MISLFIPDQFQIKCTWFFILFTNTYTLHYIVYRKVYLYLNNSDTNKQFKHYMSEPYVDFCMGFLELLLELFYKNNISRASSILLQL
jgi:hypothetical protein